MDVTIYTQDDCPPCAFVKQYFKNKGISFEEKNIKNKHYKIELIDMDQMSTPLIKINDTLIRTVDIAKIETVLRDAL